MAVEMVNITPRPFYPLEREPVPIVKEAGWASGTVWMGAENFAPPPGFDLWIVEALDSRYTDYAIPAH